MKSKIIVIIPVYNAEKSIQRCVESVINQKYKKWEMILVDDGSKDGSLKLLREYEKIDKRINVLSQKNQGAGAARNNALNYITEKKYHDKYVVFIDSDDYIENNYFNELSKHTEDLVFIDILQRDVNGKIIKKELMSNNSNNDKDTILRRQMTGYISWGGWRKAIKSNIILDNHIRYSECKIGEECIYSFQILDNAKSIGFISIPVYNYILHDDSLSASKDDDPWGPASDIMKEKLKDTMQYDKYANTINTFLLTATVVSLDRLYKNYSYADYKNKAIDRIKQYKEKVDLEKGFDIINMDNRVRLMKPLIDLKMVKLIHFICKLKNR